MAPRSIRYEPEHRDRLIAPLVAGKVVLDCGGIDHQAMDEKRERGQWLHALLAEHAARCFGVDILLAPVARAASAGFHFVVANAEALPFRGRFDVVVAGEFVEHLYNVGLFLDSAWTALKPGGVLLITTPNSYRLSGLLYALLGGSEVCHPEHTAYLSPQTLAYVVEHHGFEVEDLRLLARPSRSRVVGWLRGAVCTLRPLLGETMFLVARKCAEQRKYGDKW